jgi:hypothetical protein
MATIRAMEVPSPGSWGCRRIASRRASPPRVDPGVSAIQIVSSDPKLSARLKATAHVAALLTESRTTPCINLIAESPS